jgi:hypothetical protein
MRLRRLKEEAPAQTMTGQTRTDGNVELKTAGDFFYLAGRAQQTIDRVTIGFTAVSIVITAFLLITLKRNKIESVQ